MSVKRRKYRVSGKAYTSRFYTVEFRAPDGRLVRKSTRLTNKHLAIALENKLRGEAHSRHAGVIPTSERNKPIADHIALFVAHLTELGYTPGHVYTAGKRLNRMAREALWDRLGDISLAGFDEWRSGAMQTPWKGKSGPKPGKRTMNQFLDIARQFLDWAKKRGKIERNVLIDADRLDAPHNADYRRAETPGNFRKLLAVMPPHRQRFTKFAVYTPFRRGTFKKLRWGDVHEAEEIPWVKARGETVKQRKDLRQPLRRDIAAMMAEWRAELEPKDSDLVFPDVMEMAEWRGYLAAAGLPFHEKPGKSRLDIHALRKTAIHWMELGGAHIRDASLVIGDSEATTKKHYRERPDPMATDAVEKMPEM